MAPSASANAHATVDLPDPLSPIVIASRGRCGPRTSSSARRQNAMKASRVATAEQHHLGPHEGPVGRKAVQQHQPAIVAGVPGPGVDEAPGQRAQADRVQVHEGEGDVADDVDAAQPRVELDRIECKHLALPAHQIAQVQVAMALAHKALRAALVDQRLCLREGLVDPAPQGRQIVHGAFRRPHRMAAMSSRLSSAHWRASFGGRPPGASAVRGTNER
jgi:hypothetical protein